MGRERRGQEVQQREEECWRLRTSGLPQWAVAKQLGISQPAVSKILTRVGKRLAVEFSEEALSVKMQQTELLDRVIAEALGAWQKSKQDAESVATVQGRCNKDGDPLPNQVTRTVQGQSGNPAHLAQLRGALADIRAIWGLEAPQTPEPSGPGGGLIRISEIIVELPRLPESEATAPPEPSRNGNGDGLVVELELPP